MNDLSFLLKESNPDLTHEDMGETYLYQAVEQGNIKVIQHLLKSGAKPNTPARFSGNTPLYQAVEVNDSLIVVLLLKHNADPNIQHVHRSQTPLDLAVENSNLEIIKLLLVYDAQNTPCEFSKNTPFYFALMKGRDPELVSSFMSLTTVSLEDADAIVLVKKVGHIYDLPKTLDSELPPCQSAILSLNGFPDNSPVVFDIIIEKLKGYLNTGKVRGTEYFRIIEETYQTCNSHENTLDGAEKACSRLYGLDNNLLVLAIGTEDHARGFAAMVIRGKTYIAVSDTGGGCTDETSGSHITVREQTGQISKKDIYTLTKTSRQPADLNRALRKAGYNEGESLLFINTRAQRGGTCVYTSQIALIPAILALLKLKYEPSRLQDTHAAPQLETECKEMTDDFRTYIIDSQVIEDNRTLKNGSSLEQKCIQAVHGTSAMTITLGERFIDIVKAGNLDLIVHYLILNPQLKEYRCSLEYCALDWAAYHGHIRVVNHLLKDPPSQDNLNMALRMAVSGGNIDCVKKIMTGGANVNMFLDQSSLLGETLQLIKAHPQQPVYIDIAVLLFQNDAILLDEGKDINVLGKLLIVATKARDLGLIAQLLELESQLINFKGDYNMTPLHIAAELGYKDVLDLLINYGVNIEARTTNNAVIEAPTFSDQDMKANINGGVTPLHIAAYQGHRDILKTLLEHRANHEARGYDKTPLEMAEGSCYRDQDIVDLLKERTLESKEKLDSQSSATHSQQAYPLSSSSVSLFRSFRGIAATSAKIVDDEQQQESETIVPTK